MANVESGPFHITDLRLGTVRYDKGRAPIRFGSTTFHYAAIVATVRCNDGSVGTGFAWTQIEDEQAYLKAVQPPLATSIIGLDARVPFAAGAACRAEAGRIDAGRVSAAVEIALWDLAGRVLDVPSYQLLGCKKTSLPSYVISAEDFFLKSATQYVDLAQRYAANGFRAAKFHMWGDANRDIAACRAVRDAVGDDFVLMLDPAGRYSRDDAVRVGRAIGDLGFSRFEDPLPPADAAGYRWLATRISVPIVANESLQWNAEQCAVAARTGVVQGFRLNVGRAGIGEALRLGAIAEANGAELDIAAFVPRGGLEACFHVALAGSATRWFEHHEAMGLDEVPGISPGFVIEQGIATPLPGPGLGFLVDDVELGRHCMWVG
jgi:L-alanine-DL-glutamate epimerase-like enolase superfamily enzyme